MINSLINTKEDVITNPSSTDFKFWMKSNPHAHLTNFGNFSVKTKATARSNDSTFFVCDRPLSHQTINRVEYNDIEKLQDDYIAQKPMVHIKGYIGPDEEFRVPSQLLVEKSHANIAAMQKQLYFDTNTDLNALFNIIMTPNLKAPGYQNQRLIIVDLKNWTTRIIGSDYFGESKKGGLRMWNELVYQRGGLALHAGCKVFNKNKKYEELALIIGLSGTGKTTTTFHQQVESLPVQDDFCALFPDGKVYASEDGCFAKTYGLSEKDEPVIYHALTQSDSWLENVIITPEGAIDFHDGSHTTNGRGTFNLDAIPHRSPKDLPPVKYIFLLNRNQSIIPAVVKLNKLQAAQYFMLGETTGTSAGGASEAGKSLRIPGTNPFFTRDDALQGNRFYELIKSIPDLEIYLLNTGSVGGPEKDKRSIKVKIKHSSLIIKGIITKTINWQDDPDFGYQIAENLPDFKEKSLLNPKILYQSQNRLSEYAEHKEILLYERKAFLKQFPQLDKVLF